MAKFENTQELVWHVADLIRTRLPALRHSGSHISPSQYLSIWAQDPDNQDDQIETFCIRVSDHDARSCASRVDHSINVMRDAEELSEDGEFAGYEIADWRLEDMAADAIAAAAKRDRP